MMARLACRGWLDVELQYGVRGVDEFVFSLGKSGKAVGVEILVLREDVLKTSKNNN